MCIWHGVHVSVFMPVADSVGQGVRIDRQHPHAGSVGARGTGSVGDSVGEGQHSGRQQQDPDDDEGGNPSRCWLARWRFTFGARVLGARVLRGRRLVRRGGVRAGGRCSLGRVRRMRCGRHKQDSRGHKQDLLRLHRIRHVPLVVDAAREVSALEVNACAPVSMTSHPPSMKHEERETAPQRLLHRDSSCLEHEACP